MTAIIEIEKNIPIPTASPKYPFSKMDVGDSFLTTEKSVRSSCVIYSKKTGVKFSCYVVDGGVRVWRVK